MQHTERTPDVKVLEHKFELGCVTLGAAVSGPGPESTAPTLVLLHGVTRQWRDYQGVLPALADYGRIIVLEHRGHGASSQGHDRYRVREFVEDAVALLKTIPSQPVVLLGHSLGAMTAAMVAARAPDQVQALVLEDPPGTLLGERIEESRYWLQFNGLRDLLQQQVWSEAGALALALADLPVQHPLDGRVVAWSTLRNVTALRFAADCLIKMDPAVLDDLIAGRWLEGLDWFGELSGIQCPTLLLRSDPACGGMLSEAEARLIESRIPRCQRIDSPGHEHNLHATNPERYLDFVRRFLQPLLQPTRPS